MPSGIPQGSSSSSLLWNIYINDLPDIIEHSDVLIFADDVKIFKRVFTHIDCVLLQKDLDRFFEWTIQNDLAVNPDKCQFISFCKKKSTPFLSKYSINSTEVPHVIKTTDLGIVFDHHLTFSEHVLHVINKANRMCGFIKRSTKSFSNPDAIKTLYISLVRSVILYGSIIWRTPFMKDSKALESIQHKMMRYLSFIIHKPLHRFNHDYTDLGLIFDLPTIKTLLDYNDAIYLYKIFCGYISCNDLKFSFKLNNKVVALRHHNLFYLDLPSSHLISRNPIYRMSKLGNFLLREKPLLANFDLDISVAKKVIKDLILRFE